MGTEGVESGRAAMGGNGNLVGMPTAYIGLGANLPSRAGAPEETLAAAVEGLATLGRVTACSSLYSTAPVGFLEQPRFLNAAAALDTELSPHALLEGLLHLERGLGRDRAASVPNGPRTLDLDILLYGDLVVSGYDLEIPHPRMAERAFVLVPLSEIASQARDPRSGMRVGELMEQLRRDETGTRDIDAVVRLESDRWHAGACGDAGGAVRADRGDDCDHG